MFRVPSVTISFAFIKKCVLMKIYVMMNEESRQMQVVISILIYERYRIISHLVALSKIEKKKVSMTTFNLIQKHRVH
jgi:hypothetical protein